MLQWHLSLPRRDIFAVKDFISIQHAFVKTVLSDLAGTKCSSPGVYAGAHMCVCACGDQRATSGALPVMLSTERDGGGAAVCGLYACVCWVCMFLNICRD